MSFWTWAECTCIDICFSLLSKPPAPPMEIPLFSYKATVAVIDFCWKTYLNWTQTMCNFLILISFWLNVCILGIRLSLEYSWLHNIHSMFVYHQFSFIGRLWWSSLMRSKEGSILFDFFNVRLVTLPRNDFNIRCLICIRQLYIDIVIVSVSSLQRIYCDLAI